MVRICLATVLSAALAVGALPGVQALAQTAPTDKAAAARDTVPAKKLFGHKKGPAALKARAIGFYSRGCLAGGKAIPINGPAWQVMRLERNRNWGHPKLIAWLEQFAKDAQKHDGWPGLLVGDLAQPRGGPMLTGHASHQIGLDADVWFTPMPSRRLTRKERRDTSAISMLGRDRLSVNPKVWDDRRARLIKRAASSPTVQRVLVHPAIKKALCEAAPRIGAERAWLNKVRPYWGHHYHFHIRMHCPADSPNCRKQAATPGGDTCGKELDYWFRLLTAPPKPKPAKPSKPRPPITLASLPDQCRSVLEAPGLPAVIPPRPVRAER